MRLINIYTLKFEESTGEPPVYAILSHIWTGEELPFQEFTSPNPPVTKEGYTKIVKSCEVAQKDRNSYFSYSWLWPKHLWVDTCCIDKSSSAELSESINSMFKWYRDSAICYAYLADVPTFGPGFEADVRRSRWFRRGWTLQELIAPCDVHFYSKDWSFLGTREQLTDLIAEVTSIDPILLRRGRINPSTDTSIDTMLNSFSVARRMSWAAERETTREGYSLFLDGHI